MHQRIQLILQRLLRRQHGEAEMDEEMRFHMDAYAADLQRSGVSAEEARRRAAVQFGSVVDAKEECRSVSKTLWLDELWRNVRYAVRGMGRSPGYTAAITLTLAICIGANTAIFSVVDAVLFRPLPFGDADRLAQVITRSRIPGEDGVQKSQTGLAWEALRDTQSFEVAASSDARVGVNLAAAGKSSYVQQQRVSARYFSLLGVMPAAGREFTRDEDRTGGPAVVILSFSTWANVFGGDPKLVGSKILLGGAPHEVVGIVPAAFRPMVKADVWTPLRATRTSGGGGSNYTILARVRPGVSWAQADTEVEILGRPALSHRKAARLSLAPLQASRTREMKQPLFLLWAAVAIVLAIGCVNVAGLGLARAAGRSRELGTRIALGGGRAAVARQLGTESLLLAAMGGVAGIAIAYMGVAAMTDIAEKFGVWQQIRIDWRVGGAALALTLATSVAIGLAPALLVMGVDVQPALFAGASRSVAGARAHFSRKALVMGQITLGATLLVSSGLLVRTLMHLHDLKPGFDAKGVITAGVSLLDARYSTQDRVVWLYDRTLDRIRSTPGVESAAVGLHVPYETWLNGGVRVVSATAATSESILTTLNYVTPGYLQTLRIPVLSGRDIDDRDSATSTRVALVNEAFARKYTGTTDLTRAPMYLRSGADNLLVVGVIGDVQQKPSIGAFGPLGAVPAVFVPVTQMSDERLQLVHGWFSPQWVVRGAANYDKLTRAVQDAVASVDPSLPIAAFETFDTVRAHALLAQRFQALLLTALAAVALALTALGIYGLMAQTVVERTREMGIRIALGESGRGVLRSAVFPGMRLAAAGVASGLLLASGAARLLKSAIYGVAPQDPLTYVAVGLLLFGVALVASLLPAARLLRLDPAITLRHE